MAMTVEEFFRYMENKCINCGTLLTPAFKKEDDDGFYCSFCHHHNPSYGYYSPASTSEPKKHLDRYELLKKKEL
jgi:hypothetical protein